MCYRSPPSDIQDGHYGSHFEFSSDITFLLFYAFQTISKKNKDAYVLLIVDLRHTVIIDS